MGLFIVRHGQTIENVTEIIQGHIPGTLSELGKEQARRVALRLKNERFDYIISSDLKRAIDTANYIREYQPDTPFILTEELRETYFGQWEGRSKKELGITETYRPPYPIDAETRDQIFARAQRFLKYLDRSYHGRCLIIGHNGINKAMLAVLTGKTSPEGINDIENQHNTAVNIFEKRNNGLYCPVVLNCVKHLECSL